MRNVLLVVSVGLSILFARSTLAADDCNRATESGVNDCLMALSESADQQLQRYEQAATARMEQEHDVDGTLNDFKAGQAAWATYRKSECDAVFDRWVDGTARIAENEECKISLTRARSHEIWQNWLTSFGGSPPILPEPQTN
jgi:uncharacterized protein YecT (DUF1311 family)